MARCWARWRAANPTCLPPVLGLRLTCAAAELEGELAQAVDGPRARARPRPLSHSQRAAGARGRARPLEVARILAAVYGHELEPVIYTQGVAVSGRMRLAELDAESEDPGRRHRSDGRAVHGRRQGVVHRRRRRRRQPGRTRLGRRAGRVPPATAGTPTSSSRPPTVTARPAQAACPRPPIPTTRSRICSSARPCWGGLSN